MNAPSVSNHSKEQSYTSNAVNKKSISSAMSTNARFVEHNCLNHTSSCEYLYQLLSLSNES